MEKDKLIEAMVKALGTMIETPEYQSDPNNIGQKVIVGMVRKPILEGDARDRVIDCLVTYTEQICKPVEQFKNYLAPGSIIAPGSVLHASTLTSDSEFTGTNFTTTSLPVDK